MNAVKYGRETISRDHAIGDLLEMIHSGQLVLPEFQRDFDWGTDRSGQLLATIAKKWPIGSLLLQEFPGETFYKLRPIEGGPDVSPGQVRYVALDGQQRLTSLYQALYDTGDHIFAVRAAALQAKPTVSDLEESIRAFDQREWLKVQNSSPTPWEWIPFSVLKDPVDFFLWRDRILASAALDERTIVGDLLSTAYKNGLEAFNTYRIPSTIVESGLEPEAVARIFERVNRGGIPLGAFDLMVARTFEPEWNLRDKWEEACEAHPKIRAFFGEDGIPVIRAISLEHSRNVREGSVLALAPGIVRSRWDAAVTSMGRALDFLEERCGVQGPATLPYGGFHTVLAALGLRFDLHDEGEKLTAWYFSTAFSLGFEGAVNTRVVEEYDHLVTVFGGGPLRSQEMVSSAYLLSCTRKKKSALWKAFINILSLGRPRDLFSGDPLGAERVVVSLLGDIEDVERIEEPPGQLVLGNILADDASYQSLSRSGVWLLDDLGRGGNRDELAIRFASQLLPFPSHAVDDPHEWLLHRLRLLDGRLTEIVGVGLS
ncbi:UNVERIFIED_CONTAM: hypothetical protein ABIE34_001700 [Jeotgalibacillus campisalis]